MLRRMSKKRVLANLTPDEHAALRHRAKANRRSTAEEAGSILASVLAEALPTKSDLQPAVLS